MADTALPHDAVTFLQGRLAFVSSDDTTARWMSSKQYTVLNTDNSLVYTAFFADFGPLDLGLTYTFCTQLHDALRAAATARKSVVVHTSSHPQRRSNAAVLLLSYLILVLEHPVEEAYGPFIGIESPFLPFRDAAFAINTFALTVLDCARALHRVRSLGHFSFKDFSLPTFRRLVALENGDISWIVPGKFIAFSGPINKRRQIRPGVNTLLPEEYVPVFKSLGVTCVVRFNSKCYDRNVFLAAKIRHVDLYYEDGANPPENILQSFLQLCEGERGVIAVHCKAGLGRTGTNIAAYMIKHYGYTAKESIAWCRICRPGSVVGPQQQYLMSVEGRLKAEGDLFRQRFPHSTAGHTPVKPTLAAKASAAVERPGTSSTATSSGSSSEYGKFLPVAVADSISRSATSSPLFTPPVHAAAGGGSKADASQGSYRDATSRGDGRGVAATVVPTAVPAAAEPQPQRRPSTSSGLLCTQDGSSGGAFGPPQQQLAAQPPPRGRGGGGGTRLDRGGGGVGGTGGSAFVSRGRGAGASPGGDGALVSSSGSFAARSLHEELHPPGSAAASRPHTSGGLGSRPTSRPTSSSTSSPSAAAAAAAVAATAAAGRGRGQENAHITSNSFHEGNSGGGGGGGGGGGRGIGIASSGYAPRKRQHE